MKLDNILMNKLLEYRCSNVIIVSIFTLWLGILSILQVPSEIYTICYFVNIAVILCILRRAFYICIYLTMLLLNNFFLSTNSFYIVPMSVNSLTFLLLLFCLIITYIDLKAKKELTNSKHHISDKYIYIWMIYTIFILAFKSTNISAVYFMLVVSYFLVCVFMKNIIEGDEEVAKLFLHTYFLSVMMIVIFWYIEVIRGQTFFSILWTAEERYRMGFLRAGSTVGDNNMACLIVGTALVFFQSKPFKSLIGKNIIRISSILIVIMLGISFSRTAWVCLAVSIAFLFVSKFKKATLILLPITGVSVNYVVGIMTTLMNVDSSSSNTRMLMNDLSLTIWLNNLWQGIGWGNFTQYSLQTFGINQFVNSLGTMNTYYFILVNSGLIGGLCMLIYVISILKPSILSMYNLNSIYKYIIAAILYWLIFTFTLDTFDTIEFWIMPAIIAALYKCEFKEVSSIV